MISSWVGSLTVETHVLEEARRNARQLGHSLCFPWVKVNDGKQLQSRCISCGGVAKIAPRSFDLPRFSGPALYLRCGQ